MNPFPFRLFLLLVLPLGATAQILDDTTRQVYGPRTTRYVRESDLLRNRAVHYPVDTLLTNFHRFSFPERTNFAYTDLGTLGSPLRPLFYLPPPNLGTYLGVRAYDALTFGPENINYYDTRSPYTDLYYVQGGRGQQTLGVELSRNVTPRFNLGVRYRRLTAERLFSSQPAASGANKVNDHHAFTAYSRFFTKDSLYQALAHFSHLNHNRVEQGGIRPDTSGTLASFFDDEVAEPAFLEGAESQDARYNYHLFHELRPGRGFQFYHVFDRQKQFYRYTDDALYSESLDQVQNAEFYPILLVDTTRGNNTGRTDLEYHLLENQVGLKGSLGGARYRAWVRRRDFILRYETTSEKRAGNETFVGVAPAWVFSDSARLEAEGEVLLLRNGRQNEPDYRLRGVYTNRFFMARFERLYHSPTLLQQRFISDFFSWQTDLRNTTADVLAAEIRVPLGNLQLRPFGEANRLANYTYFDEEAQPAQANLQLLTAGLGLHWNWRRLVIEGEGRYTLRTGANPDALRVPSLQGWGRFYYQSAAFKGALDLQVGVEVYARTAWRPDAWMPVTGQFHVQNTFRAGAYPVADLFLNARIQRARLFAKLSHANQSLLAPGYFTSAYYPGLPRTFSFGVSWQFYD